MKILLVHNRYRSSSPSGEDRVVDQEHAALTDAGHEVRRFERLSDDIARMPSVRKALVPAQVVWNPTTGRRLGAAIEELRPDVVHVHNLFPLLSPAVLGICQRHRVPCVVTVHNYRQVCVGGTLFRTGAVCRDCVGRHLPLPGVRHGCYRGSSAATLPLAASSVAYRRAWRTVPSAYVFLSDAQRREHVHLGFPTSRCFVKPNHVPPAAPGTGDRDLVVYVGRLTEEKGLRVLMRAWDLYTSAATGSTMRLAVAGAGPIEGEVDAWARSRPSVEALGLLGREACASLMGRAAVVVVPSEWPEPFGLVVAEAMAAGAVPVATAHGAFTELIDDGVDGLLYPPGDADALALLLRDLQEAPARRAELGRSARCTYQRRFEPTSNVRALERIYRFAVDHPSWLGDPGATGTGVPGITEGAAPLSCR